MAHIEIVDQTLRDGPQSLWGMRIRAGMATVPGPWLDRAGYAAIDVPSGSFFTVQLRYLREDPLQTLPHVRKLLRGSRTRCGIRPSSSGRYGISPYSVRDFYVQSWCGWASTASGSTTACTTCARRSAWRAWSTRRARIPCRR